MGNRLRLGRHILRFHRCGFGFVAGEIGHDFWLHLGLSFSFGIIACTTGHIPHGNLVAKVANHPLRNAAHGR